MCKFGLRRVKMSSSAFVEEAGRWARDLVRAESRFPGDYGPAMRRVASRVGVPFSFLWNLHYRPPKSLDVEKYSALGEFYGEQQRRRYRPGRPEAKTPLGRALVGFADRLVGEDDGVVSDE